MIFIFADKKEQEIANVCDCIQAYNENVSVLDFAEFITNFEIISSLSNRSRTLKVKSKGGESSLDIKGIWYRRNTNVTFNYNNEEKSLPENILKKVINNFSQEQNAVKRILWNQQKQVNFLSTYDAYNLDKFEILKLAKSCGLEIPSTFLTNNKSSLVEVFSNHKHLITKAAYENLSFVSKGVYYMQFVETIKSEDLQKMPDYFFPSLFQEKINKEYDIRSFYIDGKFYSSAILQFEETGIDHRANRDKRIVPYKLPEDIEEKLSVLMKKIGFNTGGIDLLKHKNSYYFLEVNPSGYFGKNSAACNYNLEDKIAQYLVFGKVKK